MLSGTLDKCTNEELEEPIVNDAENKRVIRSSRSQMFLLDVFRNFANFTGKRLCWGVFLIKLQA